MNSTLPNDQRNQSSFGITWALIGFVVVGAALSIRLTSDPRWMSWHLSRLGEGGHLSSAIFNMTMGVAAIILTLIAMRVSEELVQLQQAQRVKPLRNLLIAAALCWVGVACFPFDRFPIIHNIFGYGEALLLMIAMLGLRALCPIFSQRTYTIGMGAAVIVALLLAVFLMTHAVTLLVVELIGQLALFLWLLSMTHDIRMERQKRVIIH